MSMELSNKIINSNAGRLSILLEKLLPVIRKVEWMEQHPNDPEIDRHFNQVQEMMIDISYDLATFLPSRAANDVYNHFKTIANANTDGHGPVELMVTPDQDQVVITWLPEDISRNRPGWDEKQCTVALLAISRHLRDRSIKLGREAIEDLLDFYCGDDGKEDN